jgi:hypothetical protein
MASTAHAKRVALVVGINKHDNLPRGRQLAKAVNDARAMEASAQSGSLRHSTLDEILLDIFASLLLSLEPGGHPATTCPSLVRDGIAILYLDLCSSAYVVPV